MYDGFISLKIEPTYSNTATLFLLICIVNDFSGTRFLSDLSKKFTRCFKIKMDASLLQSLYRTDSHVVFVSIQAHHTNHVFPQSVNSRATRPLRHITSSILTPSKYYLIFLSSSASWCNLATVQNTCCSPSGVSLNLLLEYTVEKFS